MRFIGYKEQLRHKIEIDKCRNKCHNGCRNKKWESNRETRKPAYNSKKEGRISGKDVMKQEKTDGNYVIRPFKKDETELLKNFLYEAIFIPEGEEPPVREIIEQPELKLYYEDFGLGKADYCMVADDNGKVIGAVWTRIMNDYGHVNDEIPSFAISLYKEYRGQGIGTKLMKEMLDLLKEKGYKRASLAVQKANYAVKMYQNVGFKTVDENTEEYIMICE